MVCIGCGLFAGWALAAKTGFTAPKGNDMVADNILILMADRNGCFVMLGLAVPSVSSFSFSLMRGSLFVAVFSLCLVSCAMCLFMEERD